MNAMVCVSGGFDPLHAGHLALLADAARHGPLTVILNSDAWLLRKKGFVFLPWQQRAAIISDLRYVAAVVPVDDTDGTVCEALTRLKPAFFANGGDRKPGNTPETSLCEKLGIGLLWNMGGGKAESSSEVARRAWVQRSWGRYVTLDEGPGYKVKKVVIEPGCAISRQYHQHRSEFWYMAGEGAQVEADEKKFAVAANAAPVIIEPRMVHRLSNTGATALTIIEIQSGPCLEEDDIVRMSEAQTA
ncbi:MAG: hypothetical protein EBV03_03250 [Proteobacteria bacterium]|nr:hypothetical protein [Pseudomonadota bacterium]